MEFKLDGTAEEALQQMVGKQALQTTQKGIDFPRLHIANKFLYLKTRLTLTYIRIEGHQELHKALFQFTTRMYFSSSSG